MKKQVNFKIDPEIKIMLDDLCKINDRSQAKMISKLIRREYERVNKK